MMETNQSTGVYVVSLRPTDQNGAHYSPWQLLLALVVPVFLVVSLGPRFWAQRKFRAHRLSGVLFLLHYAWGWYLLVTQYAAFSKGPIMFTIALHLVAQVVTAIYTFTFLPKNSADPGIYSEKGVLPYKFVVEALFFALMQLWGGCYYHDQCYAWLDRSGLVGTVLECCECLWVFLPFTLIRPLFPKTHFRDALKNREKNTSSSKQLFYDIGTHIIKVFYVASKHLIGFHLNYLRFLNLLSPEDMYWVRWMLMVNIGTQSIGTFTHTLRFKGLMHPQVAYSIYVAYAYASFYSLLGLGRVYGTNLGLLALTLAGMVLNFTRYPKLQGAYQWVIMLLLLGVRHVGDVVLWVKTLVVL